MGTILRFPLGDYDGASVWLSVNTGGGDLGLVPDCVSSLDFLLCSILALLLVDSGTVSLLTISKAVGSSISCCC